MTTKTTSLAVCAMLFALCVSAPAQQPTKVRRIGYLAAASFSANATRTDAFRQGLRDLEYLEGKNIVIEWRYAEGKRDRLPALAADLVRLNVHVMVTAGPSSTRAAKEATSKIPVVMAQDADPVGSGFVSSFARPGGNITGLSALSPELSGKRLELLKESIPKLSRVAVLGTSPDQSNAQSLREVDLAAGSFGVTLQHLDVLGPKDIETAFRAATKGRADAVLVLASPSSILSENRLSNLRQRTGSRRYIIGETSWKKGGL